MDVQFPRGIMTVEVLSQELDAVGSSSRYYRKFSQGKATTKKATFPPKPGGAIYIDCSTTLSFEGL